MRFRMCMALLLLTGWAVAAPAPEAAAQEVARAWLVLVDGGNYADSWTQAATLFRDNVTQAQWQSAAESARGPVGALKARQVQSATFRRDLPGAPDGEYVVIQFASAFRGKASAIETVTVMKDRDGSWRVAGYYLK
ncbi:MAG: DUF4019 domain-containing protein [Gammaproteobacteria bacterium]|nr:DUF4019 domain-containing protein [Gammaproteobacteria bacterium]